MARTFNRMPLSVGTPSSSDVKDYFFTHANWKGLSNDKNYLTVDQETFSDCNNVYMDSEGLLRSRPSIKSTNIMVNLGNGLKKLSTIIDVWKFDTVKVYHSVLNNVYYLTFVNDNFTNAIQIVTEANVKLITVERKIFIFARVSNSSCQLWYYDLDGDNQIHTAYDYIYIPTTKLVSYNTVTKDLEEPNEFTTSHNIEYLTNIDNIDLLKLKGNTLDVTINGITNKITFNGYERYTFLTSYTNRKFDCMYEENSTISYPNVSVSEEGSIVITEIVDDIYYCYYSSDGIVFRNLPPVEHGVGMPVISQDGSCVFVTTTDDLLISQVIRSEIDESMPYTWVGVLRLLETQLSLSPISFSTFPYVTVFALSRDSYALEFHNEDDIYCISVVNGTPKFFTNGHSMLNGTRLSNMKMKIFGTDYQVVIYLADKIWYIDENDLESVIITTSTKGLYTKNHDLDIINKYTCRFTRVTYAGQYQVELVTMRLTSGSVMTVSCFIPADSLNITNIDDLDKLSFRIFNNMILSNNALYTYDSGALRKLSLFINSEPLYTTEKTIYTFNDGVVYSTLTSDDVISMIEFVKGEYNWIRPDCMCELQNHYFSVNKTLYISSYPLNGEFKWYFPKINTEQLDYTITNLHPISQQDVAVFTEDYIYYITSNYNSDKLRYEYFYNKSKIQVGCKSGASIITTYDGKYTVFSSNRGLVAMSYQDFIASTEQVLTCLSDTIYDTYKNFSNGNVVKLYKKDFWIVCYISGTKQFLVFDVRNNSWWPMSIPYDITKIITLDEEVLCLSGEVCGFDVSDDDYYDCENETREFINWYVRSQKLHLSYPNYTKHISNITLTSVLDDAKDLHLDLTLYNYRKRMHTSDVESFKFDVDSIRVYVKRLNYSKVNEFQYLLTSDIDDVDDMEEYMTIPKYPLSLSSINIKYKVSGQVR